MEPVRASMPEPIRLGPVTIVDNGDGVIRENDRFLGPFVPGPDGGRGITMREAEGRLAGLGVGRLDGVRMEELQGLQPQVNRLWRAAEERRDEGVLPDVDLDPLFEAIGGPLERLVLGILELFE